MIEAHEQFKASLTVAQGDFNQLAALDKQIKSFNVGPNPYTWFTMEALDETWKSLQRIIKERDDELVRERERQEDNDKLRKQFAQAANAFHQWLTDARSVWNSAAHCGIVFVQFMCKQLLNSAVHVSSYHVCVQNGTHGGLGHFRRTA